MRKNRIYLLLVAFLLGMGMGNAQEGNLLTEKISYTDYLNRVATNNLGYLAEKYHLDIADAAVTAAKVFPDPEWSFGWVDNGQRRMEMGYGFETELSWDLELGGKRKARKNLAGDQKELAVLELQNYFEELRAEVTIAFLQSLQLQQLVTVKRDSYLSIKQISESDSIRFSLGQLTKVGAVQSRLEANAMGIEVVEIESEWENSLLELKKNFSVKQTDSLYLPQGSFDKLDRLFDFEELLYTARTHRSAYLIAKQNQLVISSEVRLAQAERVMDLGLTVGVENNSFVRNAVAPTPGNTAVKAGISVPLKFSNRREAGLKTALYQQQQVQLRYRDRELELEKDIAQALRTYQTKQRQLKQFEENMLNDSQEVLAGIVYSYQRGASSLLEVLNAQRTHNETREAYVMARFDYAVALVELEKAVGIWDIEF